ncbi:LOW QUALITY PROTEIN: DNA/RNA polymerase [Phytophthora palmivora]|uniref:DNA/RNA polymerase n=1 Tax=Phytophthora palmivora TaxID=4796 RepID=A0A2P4YDI5_9STRA|nr:LOW QUALITY PROTEIN: DNA/RNA polymerase [Phytophthora palmivora]
MAEGKTMSRGSMAFRFRIPHLKRDSVIAHNFEVLPTLKDEMVIGRDIMTALSLVVDFGSGRVRWDGSEMKINTSNQEQPSSEARGLVEIEDECDDELFSGEDTNPADLLPQHLEAALQHCYLKLLEEYHDLYCGRLERIRLPDYVLPLTTDSHAKPYSIARSREDAARCEIKRLIDLDVVEQIYGSEAAAPFRAEAKRLNQFLRRSPYFVQKIREILLCLDKAKCLSTLDANMGYFARRLIKTSRSFTAFCLPFGKFQFKRLPMGISTTPDEYQACMENILGDLPFVIRLREYDVTLNASKCHISRESVDYLGFTLTPIGILPQAKKVESIQQIAEPRNKKELCREIVPDKSALTAQLNRPTLKNVPFVWAPEAAAAFQDIKTALVRNIWLAFPDYSRPFHVFAVASGRQIGGVIVQGKRIIACFSCSMTDTQRKYTTMEWELLSVVDILKEYRTMLLGFPVTIHTDHKDDVPAGILTEGEALEITARGILTLRTQNIGADAFSRLRYNSVKQTTEDDILAIEEEEEVTIDGFVTKKHQLEDSMTKEIISRLEGNAAGPDYSLRPALGAILLHYKERVVVPDSLRKDLVELYHDYLVHPGGEKQIRSMSTFWWPVMETEVKKFVSACLKYNRAKLHGGEQDSVIFHLHQCQTKIEPLMECIFGQLEGDYYCLTGIERQFRCLEVMVQNGRTSATTALSFESGISKICEVAGSDFPPMPDTD